jgi:thioesterase domain-containing protein
VSSENTQDEGSQASQLLSECWLSALGSRPTGYADSLPAHGAGRKERARLAHCVREAFRCDLTAQFFKNDIPFGKTADLLQALLPGNHAAEPVIYHAPGIFGIQLGDLLLAREFPGPGRIQLIRYPRIGRARRSPQIIQDLALATIEQLPPHQPGQPLILTGFSFGAHVMHEAACMLTQAERTPDKHILIKTIAFPTSEHFLGINVRLSECRSRWEFERYLLWKCSGLNAASLRGWAMLIRLVESAGWFQAAERLELANSSSVYLKALMKFRPSRFPGTAFLLRPSDPKLDPDDGWSELCGSVHPISFPVSEKEFWYEPTRGLAIRELAGLIGDS